MRKFNRKRSVDFPCNGREYPLEQMLKLVDQGQAHLKAQYDWEDNLKVNIYPDDDTDVFYHETLNITHREFNEKYGKKYITQYNLYL